MQFPHAAYCLVLDSLNSFFRNKGTNQNPMTMKTSPHTVALIQNITFINGYKDIKTNFNSPLNVLPAIM